MKSPLYPNLNMLETTINEGPKVWQCPQSKGIYIRFADYRQWLRTVETDTDTTTKDFQPIEVTPEDARAKSCPESGGILRRYHISSDLPIHLDWSPSSGGIWLDGGEWDILVEHSLHTQLHNIISDSWQRNIRKEATETRRKERLEDKLGEADYQKVSDFKTWLSNHLHRSEILAYLQHTE